MSHERLQRWRQERGMREQGEQSRGEPDRLKAFRALQERREAVLATWGARVRQLLTDKGRADILEAPGIDEDLQGVFECLLNRLRERGVDGEFAPFYHWIYDGAQYDVQLGDVHRALLELKGAASGAVAAAAADDKESAGLTGAVAGVIDGMVARCVELYQSSREVELLTIRDRLQRMIAAWQVADSIAGIQSTRDLFVIAHGRLAETFDLAGCVVRLYGSAGEKEKDLCSAREAPLPLVRARPQYLSAKERQHGGVLDALELCRRARAPFFCEVGSSGEPPAPEPAEANGMARARLVNPAVLFSAGVRGVACVPMVAGEQLAGVLLLLVRAAGGFQASEVRLLRDLADVLAPAFARALGIEESRRQMTRAEVIARIGRSLLELPTLEGLLRAVVEALQAFRHYSRVRLYRMDEASGECVLVAEAGAAGGGGPSRLRPGQGLVGRCAASGEPVSGEQGKGPGRGVIGGGPPDGALRELAMPISKAGRVIGVVELASEAEDAFGKAERSALSDLSMHIGVALQNAEMLERQRRHREEIDEEHDKLNLVVDAMGAGLALFDGECRLQWANSTCMRWFGLGADAFDRPCQEVLLCDGRCEPECALHAALRTGERRTETMERTDADGEWHCYMRVVTPAEHGRTRLLTLMTDITAQRRQTEKLQLINRLTRALEGTLDLRRVQHVVLTCMTAGHAIGFNRAFLFLLEEEEEEEEAELAGSMAVGPSSAREAARIWQEITESSRTLEDLLSADIPDAGGPEAPGQPLTAKVRGFRVPLRDKGNVLVQALSRREPIVVRNAREDRRVGPALAAGLELEEFVCMPLVARGQSLGVLLADNKFSRVPIDEGRVDLVRMFSAQASLAIANARAYQQITTQVEEIRRTHHELIEAERFAGVGRMAAHLAHEIRNPLTAIGGIAAVIRESAEANERTRKNAGLIYDETIRLENTLADVLDFARPKAPEVSWTDLNEVIRETVREFNNELRDNAIRLRLELADGLPQLRLDPNRIKQAMINLVKNAVQALEDAEDRVLLVATGVDDDAVSFSVADSGCGMSRETQGMLFAPFFTTKKGGSGLGLSVTRKIIGEHGGRISVESEPGKGSAFHVVLPLAGVQE